MNTVDVELALMRKLNFRQNIIVHNVTDLSGLVRFETDMISLTKNGYATGFEIKVSRSDLLADFKKAHHLNMDEFFGFEYYYEPFKYFNYAVPSDLKELALDVIPKWCGLYVVYEYSQGDGYYCLVERKPKKLFNRKWSDEQMIKLAHLGAMRIYNLKKRVKG